MDKVLWPECLETDPNSSVASKEWLHWKRTFENFLQVLPQAGLDKLGILTNYVSPTIFQYIEECTDYTVAMKCYTTLDTRLQLMWSLSWDSGGQWLSFLVCLNLLWLCSLIETSDRVKWDSPITKWSFIFKVSCYSHWSGADWADMIRNSLRFAPRSVRMISAVRSNP